MKKQLNTSAASRKLSLNKKTISNLSSSEMTRVIGGWATATCFCTEETCRACGGHSKYPCGGTRNGNTCPGHNTCYTC